MTNSRYIPEITFAREGKPILSGKEIAKQIESEVANNVKHFRSLGLKPQIAVVIANDDKSVMRYQSANQKSALELGINYHLVTLEKNSSQTKLNHVVDDLVVNPTIHGILLSLPIYPHLNAEEALNRIPASKDIDGLTAENLGLICSMQEEAAILTTTPMACIRLLNEVTTIKGKTVSLLGTGKTVGWPLAQLLKNRGATVIACNEFTRNLPDLTRCSEIIICCAGVPNLLGPEHINESQNQIIIDAAINVVDGKVRGDSQYERLIDKVEWITPVPGGIGPITNSMLYLNLVKAIRYQGSKIESASSH